MTEVISTMQKTGRWLSGKEAKDQGEEDIVLNKAIQGRPPSGDRGKKKKKKKEKKERENFPAKDSNMQLGPLTEQRIEQIPKDS